MPPQMESNAIHDAMHSTRTRRALANVNVSQDSIPGSTTSRTRSKRSVRAQDKSTSKVVSSSGTPATHCLTPTTDFNTIDGGNKAMTTVRDRVSAMQEKFGAQLEFLITEFTKLEEQLLQVPNNGSNSASRAEDVQLTRLRYFVAHVRRTVERMEQAKTGQHRYTLEQLDMLDEHITRRLLPVKDKLIAQLGQRPRVHESSGLFDSYRLLTPGDASAVSEGWMSSDGSTTDNEVSNAPSMAQPSSSPSLAELSELCGDPVGDDYAGSYLVGQDCDDVDDSAIGLDIYDVGHGKDFLFSRDNSRADSVSTMSAGSAVTDEEMSDDSLSVDDTSLAKSAIDQEMGELSKLFAPDDSFLPISLLDPEDKKAETIEAKEAMTIVPTLQEDERNDDDEHHIKQMKQDATPIGPVLEPKTEISSTPVVSSAAVEARPQQSVVNTSASTAMSHPIKKEECSCSGFAVPCKRSVDSLVHPAQRTNAENSTVLSAPLGPSPSYHSFRQRKRQRSSLAPILSAPRNVKYECSLCKEGYQCSISSNPWWSLLKQECPKCHRVQIPRVDAASAAVCVDSIHAVCAEEGEGGDSDGYGSDSCSETDDDDDQGPESLAVFNTENVAGDVSPGCTESRLSTSQASRLLVLMAHARNCPGVHANPRHAEACQSTKFLMLHIRDCSGYGPMGEPCPYNWCRPCKSLLSHLVHCTIPGTCRICSPAELSSSFHMLRELNAAQAREAAAPMATATIMKTEDGL